MIREFFMSLFYSCLRDPCRRCLIRVMCTQECPDRIRYYQHTQGIPIFYRVAGLSTAISVATLILIIYRWIIN